MNAGRPLRRTRTDLAVTAVLTACAVAGVGVVAATAPVNSVHHLTAAPEAPAEPGAGLEQAPAAVEQDWIQQAEVPEGVHRPVVVDGVVVVPGPDGVRALDATGRKVWSYARDGGQLCAATGAWSKVALVFRTGVGCGDVVALNASDGSYAGTRSALAPTQVLPVASNSRLGILAPERVELWRSDLVRTVEYGEVRAKQEPDQQPHEGCRITSALTRTELLALTEVCPADDGQRTWLRFQETTPEDSREPELKGEAELPEGARLVAVGQQGAAVYVPGETPQLRGVDQDGREVFTRDVAPAPGVPAAPDSEAWAAATADLPHHMTWFDGRRLYLLRPSGLEVDRVVEDAVGTGVALGDRLVYPTADGLAVYDWSTGEVERTVPVDRDGYSGPVGLSLLGDRILEQRGDRLVALRPA